ncbi:MAG: transposase [Gammaproteobacteria bacterium]|jgi:REP element-mobilizing transposase RayT|nr:transposase [Gammaproteobacteria bacterium]MBT4993513.1 transposase [Candidatus Neomarinimicrobiota bacterium]MBT5372448.1 transposase [Gammaproteobacteria bacterium]
MTQARASLVSIEDTPWYHCVNRCVRRAFLCGEDPISGNNYEHRRGWIADRIKQLASVYAIDVAGYAVMSNHYHVVMRIDQERALSWSVDDVLERWNKLFTGPLVVQRYLSPEQPKLSEAEVNRVHQLAEEYRHRLYDLSWFMRTLNEHIARAANQEEGVKGRFWEGRFKSQALLDQQAILAAMTYVDLNPIRAGMAETPEASDFTSIQERIEEDLMPEVEGQECEKEVEQSVAGDGRSIELPQAPLMPFDGTGELSWAIPFSWEDYLELVEWTGRSIVPRKHGYIAAHQPAIFVRLGIDPDYFAQSASKLLKEFGSAVGAPVSLINLAASRQVSYLRGIHSAKRLFEQRQAA